MSEIKNESGLHPQGVGVLVYAWEPELLSSILEIPASVREGLQLLENRVTVIEIGPAAWADEKVPRARVGDVVLIQKHSGYAASGADGKLYRLVNARDIFCCIDTKLFAKAKAKGIKLKAPEVDSKRAGRKPYSEVEDNVKGLTYEY